MNKIKTMYRQPYNLIAQQDVKLFTILCLNESTCFLSEVIIALNVFNNV